VQTGLDSFTATDLAKILVSTFIGAAIGLIGPILYSRLSRHRETSRATSPDGSNPPPDSGP
jgi:hypothetical protein